MTTKWPWQPLIPARTLLLYHTPRQFIPIRHMAPIQAFKRSDFDMLARRIASVGTWKDAWLRANDSFEYFVYETKKTAEIIDRRYGVLQRLSVAAQSTAYRAREIDRKLEISRRWHTFTLDFSRNWPMYKKQLSDILETPIGRAVGTLVFIWFALSGWLSQFLVLAVWVLPFTGLLFIVTEAEKLKIQGNCPSCRSKFIGYKFQRVCCTSCGNIVWQPQDDSFSKTGRHTKSSSKSQADVIDVEFEEK